jgi:hypothetical protein
VYLDQLVVLDLIWQRTGEATKGSGPGHCRSDSYLDQIEVFETWEWFGGFLKSLMRVYSRPKANPGQEACGGGV